MSMAVHITSAFAIDAQMSVVAFDLAQYCRAYRVVLVVVM